MAITIYGDPGSGSRRRVTAAAAAMGIDLQVVDIDLFKGESHTPEFLELNPHGLSPVMVDGDVVLYEASAINLYLAEKAGSDLAGRTPPERFQILQWMFWSGEQWRIFATLTFDEVLGKRFMDEPANEAIVGLAAGKIRAAAAVLDAHLAEHDFIVGDRVTLADFDVAGPFSQNERTGIPLNEFSNLVRWQQRLLATVPSWAATKREVDERIDGALAKAGIRL